MACGVLLRVASAMDADLCVDALKRPCALAQTESGEFLEIIICNKRVFYYDNIDNDVVFRHHIGHTLTLFI